MSGAAGHALRVALHCGMALRCVLLRAELDARQLLNQPPEEELTEKAADINFATAMVALTIVWCVPSPCQCSQQYYVAIRRQATSKPGSHQEQLPVKVSAPHVPRTSAIVTLGRAPRSAARPAAKHQGWLRRYLAQGLAVLPLGLLPRLVVTNDTVMALVDLLAKPPWERRRGAALQRFAGGGWQAADGAAGKQLCQPEAQVQLSLGLRHVSQQLCVPVYMNLADKAHPPECPARLANQTGLPWQTKAAVSYYLQPTSASAIIETPLS